MSESTFFILFGVAWVAGMAYGLSAWRLLARVRRLKTEGRAPDAPDPLTNPLEAFGYLGWLLGGRYAELNDHVATRWSGIAGPVHRRPAADPGGVRGGPDPARRRFSADVAPQRPRPHRRQQLPGHRARRGGRIVQHAVRPE